MEYTKCTQAEVSDDGKTVRVRLQFDNGSKVDVDMDEGNTIMLVAEIVNHVNNIAGSDVVYEIGRRQTKQIQAGNGENKEDSGQGQDR